MTTITIGNTADAIDKALEAYYQIDNQPFALDVTRRVAFTTFEGERKFALVRNFTLVG